MFLLFSKKHVVLITVIVFLLITAGVIYAIWPKAPKEAETANWGLSFQEDGKTPVGNADRKTLQKYGAYYVGNEKEKVIYLTFDAGYENGYTEQILDTLKKHGVKATFFLVGNYIETHPELVRRMTEEGHVVGNHTYSHPDMSKIADMESFRNEIEKLEKLYFEATGQQLQKFYRPPQGIFSEENLKMAQELGYTTVFWSLAYVDWYVDDQPTHEEAFKKLCGRIHPGAIVLLHSTSKTNAEILDELLCRWEKEGYTFQTVDTLKNGTAQ